MYLEQIMVKVGLLPSPSKKTYFTSYNESPLKAMKNAFYFILKALLVFKIFKKNFFLTFGHEEKMV